MRLSLFAGFALFVLACSSPAKKEELPLNEDDSTAANGATGAEPTTQHGNAPEAEEGEPRGDDKREEPAPAPANDAGADASPPPPPPYPFLELDVRYPVVTDLFVTECTPDGATQLVWKTIELGTDAYSRFANPVYTQKPNVFGGCGTKTKGEYPIVFTSLASPALPTGTFVAKCVGTNQAHVYKVTGTFEGHPSATWQYAEAHPACL